MHASMLWCEVLPLMKMKRSECTSHHQLNSNILDFHSTIAETCNQSPASVVEGSDRDLHVR